MQDTSQRWFIRHHGKVFEVDYQEYVAAAKRGDLMGITTFDGSEVTWDDFNRSLSRALGGDTDEPSPTANPPRSESVTDTPLEAAL